MSLFKKKNSTVDTIDLPDLQRKGLLKRAQKIDKEESTSSDYIDLSNLASTQSNAQSISSQPQIPDLSFLSNLAGAGQSENQLSENQDQESSKELQHLKIKIEDIEYKMDALMDRLAKLETKLNLKS